MKAKKRGKRTGLRARSKNAREKTALKSIMRKIALIENLAKAQSNELVLARSQLQRCRAVMEANDPGNARDIFGPPLDETQPAAHSAPPAEPARNCPNCDSFMVSMHHETDEFTYGVAPSGVVLKAEVDVFECANCKERWTGEQGEAARAAAVERYLAGEEGCFV